MLTLRKCICQDKSGDGAEIATTHFCGLKKMKIYFSFMLLVHHGSASGSAPANFTVNRTEGAAAGWNIAGCCGRGNGSEIGGGLTPAVRFSTLAPDF